MRYLPALLVACAAFASVAKQAKAAVKTAVKAAKTAARA